MNLVFATIIYKPDTSVWPRLNEILNTGHKLIIFDNSPIVSNCPGYILASSGVLYLEDKTNAGLGRALRHICRAAFFDNQQYLLYFDQDTFFTAATLEYILSVCKIVDQESAKYEGIEQLSSITFRDASVDFRGKAMQISNYKLNLVDFTINSGTLFFLKKLAKIGWHDPGFFIDGVDYSYCLAAAVANYYIAEIVDVPGLDHSIGQDDSMYSFFGLVFRGRRYPKYRRKDFFVSSVKLIIRASAIDMRKALWLLKTFFIYFSIQMMIPFSRKIAD